MTYFKKTFMQLSVIAFIVFVSVPLVLATEASNNVGVSTEEPETDINENPQEEISPFGLAKPGKNDVINLTKKQMDFKRKASGSKLYTNCILQKKSTQDCNEKIHKLASQIYLVVFR